MSRRRHGNVPGTDDEDWESLIFSFDLGRRLDLPEDFVVPPLRVAALEELAVAARGAPAMARLVGFVDWVGKGRRLDEDGELEAFEQEDLGRNLGLEREEWFGLDDEDEVVPRPFQSEAFVLTEWAVLAGLVRQRGQKLLRTAIGRNMQADPLIAWRSAFDALLELGLVDAGGNGPPWGDTVDSAMPDVIVLVNTAGGPLAVSQVVERICSQVEELLSFTSQDDATAGLQQAIAEDTQAVLNKLVELGVVSLDGSVLRGTPLGAWAAVQLLEEDGFEVPVIG